MDFLGKTQDIIIIKGQTDKCYLSILNLSKDTIKYFTYKPQVRKIISNVYNQNFIKLKIYKEYIYIYILYTCVYIYTHPHTHIIIKPIEKINRRCEQTFGKKENIND